MSTGKYILSSLALVMSVNVIAANLTSEAISRFSSKYISIAKTEGLEVPSKPMDSIDSYRSRVIEALKSSGRSIARLNVRKMGLPVESFVLGKDDFQQDCLVKFSTDLGDQYDMFATAHERRNEGHFWSLIDQTYVHEKSSFRTFMQYGIDHSLQTVSAGNSPGTLRFEQVFDMKIHTSDFIGYDISRGRRHIQMSCTIPSR